MATELGLLATVVDVNPPLTLFQPAAPWVVLLARHVPAPKAGEFFQWLLPEEGTSPVLHRFPQEPNASFT